MIDAGRAYAVTFQAVNISVKQDLFYVAPASNKATVIAGVYLSNVGVGADAGDAQEEVLDVQALYLPATVTVGSSGTSATARPFQPSDTAYGGTCRVNDTTVATTNGTRYPLHADGWNVRLPYAWAPEPKHRPYVVNGAAFVFRLAETGSAMADAIAVNGTLLLEELG